MSTTDFSPSAERNKQAILQVLQHILPPSGTALEIASGTGQHVEWFAQHLPQWTWQPSDAHLGAIHNIEARANAADLGNVLGAVLLDVCDEPWFTQGGRQAHCDMPVDLVLCINMLHISPWAACGALMRGSALHLSPGGLLVTYGPYFEAGVEPTPSNLAFDQSLRAQNPSWGIRQIADVQQEAAKSGLTLRERHALPANNLLLVWARAG